MSRSVPIEVGVLFGRLTTIRETEPYLSPGGQRQRRILCRCVCGATVAVTLAKLRSGLTRSCGCLSRDTAASIKTHGLSHHCLYNRWVMMIQRCHNPANSAYRRYGGRGIQVCARWRNSFSAFLEDVGEPPTLGHSLDRIDPDGGYTQENVRWATAAQQRNNRSPAFPHPKTKTVKIGCVGCGRLDVLKNRGRSQHRCRSCAARLGWRDRLQND